MVSTTRCNDDIDAAIGERMQAATVWALPARCYADPEIYRAERQHIFARHWLWVGREAELAEPGRYITAAPVGFPLFVRRAEDGTLRAFHNVCRHRASRLLTEASGHCHAIQCPYHGWRYRSDGALDHAPLFGEAADFPKRELSLFPVAVALWRGLVFVCLDPAAAPLAEWLGPIVDAVEETAPARAVFDRELVFHVECNWKTYVDNYQEGYHIPPLHPGLHRDLDWKRYRVVNFAGGSLHEAPPKGGSVHPGSFGWRFPNFTFNSYVDGLSFMRMEPAGPSRTRLVYHYWRPDTVSAEDFEATVAYGRLVSEEDQWIVPLIQQNLEAGVYEAGPLSPRHENGVFHFHEMVRAALGSAASGGSHAPSASPGTTAPPAPSTTSG